MLTEYRLPPPCPCAHSWQFSRAGNFGREHGKSLKRGRVRWPYYILRRRLKTWTGNGFSAWWKVSPKPSRTSVTSSNMKLRCDEFADVHHPLPLNFDPPYDAVNTHWRQVAGTEHDRLTKAEGKFKKLSSTTEKTDVLRLKRYYLH